jgi:lysophospholipid hydrolase
MTQYGLQLLDLTYPITSMFSGKQFNKTIRDTFGDNVKIEDLCKLKFAKNMKAMI